jgi:hypothetical protein
MHSSLKVGLALVGLVAGATSLSALEGTFSTPRYKAKERLDICYSLGKSCGQKAADAFCLVAGFDKAVGFEKERARPTRTIADGKLCDGPHCEAFKSITCFTSAKRPSPRDWPTPHD